MSNNINPNFIETIEQRKFRQIFMERMYSAYHFDDNSGLLDIGEDKKISLQDIYVPLRFSKIELNEDRDWGIEENLTSSLIEVLDESKHVVISGKPGSGKTTVSKIIITMLSSKALTAITKKYGRRLPLYFRLRNYDIRNIETADDLVNMYIEDQSKTLGLEISKDILKFYLENGWCFLLVDGVDEVGGINNRLKIREIILKKFALFNEDNYIIVTSRPSGLERVPFNKLIEGDKQEHKDVKFLDLFYVDSFNKEQVREFSEKWFALREISQSIIKDKTNDFLESIEKIKSLSVLRRRPVFLTMMIHIHTTKGKLPHSRATAYEEMVKAYIENIDITRRLHKGMYPDENYAEWNFEDKLKLLQGIAYEFHCSISNRKDKKVQIVVTRKRLLNVIEKIIREKQDQFQTLQLDDKEAVLSFYLTRTGLLHEPEQDKIQFSHLSFQEYLTARYIYTEVIENFFTASEIINKEIASRLNEDEYSRWQEIILLFFSMNKTSTDQILELMKKNKKFNEFRYYFTHMIILMLNSEEYGIKKKQEKKWIKEVIVNIAIIDEEIKSLENDKITRKYQNKGVGDLLELFLVNQKINIQIEDLKEIFYEYFEKIKLNNSLKENYSIFMVILKIILHNKNTSMLLKNELELAIKFVVNEHEDKLYFISCAEEYFDTFNELSATISESYDLNEKIIVRDFVSSTVYQEFSNNNRWDYKILEYEYIIRELLIIRFFLKAMNIFKINGKLSLNKMERSLFKEMRKAECKLWDNHWELKRWHYSCNGYKLARYRNLARGLVVSHLSDDKLVYRSRFSEIIGYCNINDIIKNEIEKNHINNFVLKFEKIIDIIEKNSKNKKVRELSDCCEIIELMFLVILSDYKFSKTCREIKIPWKNFVELREFNDICCSPKKLYDYLECSNVVDYSIFVEQYNKYFFQPYSFLNILKFIFESEDENILTYSFLDILKMCNSWMYEIKEKLDSIIIENKE
ncbi:MULTISPECIES: NACHT domain-containing protein [unclassified Clostridium]|uniref:NACHT domain-containing protein n=1 Tax=unclassified Clostridium TaxID=2614128 RepID=UPI0002986D16|nr:MULTISPECIES: NACHT domain-containing protein [unclassified Clostridium]EKQ54567.1 MAG: putative NTPase (NACHT family) [Clostridium sp. Maddingley MBC34-26]